MAAQRLSEASALVKVTGQMGIRELGKERVAWLTAQLGRCCSRVARATGDKS